MYISLYVYCKKLLKLAIYLEPYLLLSQRYDLLNLCILDGNRGVLHVFFVGIDETILLSSYDLFVPGKMSFSVVDNLIIVHNAAAKVPIIFDICLPRRVVVAPLPLIFSEAENVDLYSHDWNFVNMDLVVNLRTMLQEYQVFQLSLNLDFISKSWGYSEREDLVRFLMRRENGKGLLFRCVNEMIQEVDLTSRLQVSNLFFLFNHHCKFKDTIKSGQVDELKYNLVELGSLDTQSLRSLRFEETLLRHNAIASVDQNDIIMNVFDKIYHVKSDSLFQPMYLFVLTFLI